MEENGEGGSLQGQEDMAEHERPFQVLIVMMTMLMMTMMMVMIVMMMLMMTILAMMIFIMMIIDDCQ